MEIIIDGLYYLYVLQGDASNVAGWPKGAGFSQRGSSNPVIVDMDNDKQIEVIENEYYS